MDTTASDTQLSEPDADATAKRPLTGTVGADSATDFASGSATDAAGGDRVGRAIELIDIARIMELIPHRYPFLMIDRVVDVVLGHSAIGVKNVTINENHFQGHFPAKAVMPGVLIIESMAQTAAVFVVETLGPVAYNKVVYFMSIEGAKFRRPVVPGDQLRIHVVKERSRGMVWKVHAIARVDGVAVAEATYTAMIVKE